MSAELCPVCKGIGKLYDPICDAAVTAATKICHGCGGMGWVGARGPEPFVFYPPQLPYPQLIHNSVSEGNEA